MKLKSQALSSVCVLLKQKVRSILSFFEEKNGFPKKGGPRVERTKANLSFSSLQAKKQKISSLKSQIGKHPTPNHQSTTQ